MFELSLLTNHQTLSCNNNELFKKFLDSDPNLDCSENVIKCFQSWSQLLQKISWESIYCITFWVILLTNWQALSHNNNQSFKIFLDSDPDPDCYHPSVSSLEANPYKKICDNLSITFWVTLLTNQQALSHNDNQSLKKFLDLDSDLDCSQNLINCSEPQGQTLQKFHDNLPITFELSC